MVCIRHTFLLLVILLAQRTRDTYAFPGCEVRVTRSKQNKKNMFIKLPTLRHPMSNYVYYSCDIVYTFPTYLNVTVYVNKQQQSK